MARCINIYNSEICEASAGNSVVCGRVCLQHGRGQHGASKRLLEQCVCSKKTGSFVNVMVKTMITDKRHWSNKLVSLLLVLIIASTGFYGLTIENATAQSEIPDYALQIAEQYKATDESYEIIETNNGVDKGYFVIIYYLDLGPGKNEDIVTGSIIINMTSQKLLDKNELSQSDFENILKFSSLVWRYDIDQETALAKGQFFYGLSEDMYDAAELVENAKNEGRIVNFIDVAGTYAKAGTHPIILLMELYGIVGAFCDTFQIADIQEHMTNILQNYKSMGANYEQLSYYWYRISEGKYEHADELIPRSSSLDQESIDLYIDILNDAKFIASQEISIYCIPMWNAVSPEEIEYFDKLILKFSDRQNFLEEVYLEIISDYHILKSNYRFVGTTTTGTISESVTSDSITVTATYSGNDDYDGSALLYYKQHSSSSWLATDGAMAKGYLTKQYRKTISGLSENTEYDVKVLYSDPDGVSGTNPIYKYRIKTAQSGGTPPSAPTLDDPGTTDGDGTYVVRWSYRVDAMYYELEESGANSQTYNNIMYVTQPFSGKENGVYNYRVRACNDYGCSGWSNVESITVSLEPVSDNSYAGALYSGRVQNANDAKSYLHGVYKVKIIERRYTEPSFDQIEATAIIYKNSVSLGLYTLKYHEMVYADNGNVQVLLKEAGIYKPSYEYGEDVAICTKTSSSDVNANPCVFG